MIKRKVLAKSNFNELKSIGLFLNGARGFYIFNQIIDEFFIELIDIFPEETKIKVQYTLFQTLAVSLTIIHGHISYTYKSLIFIYNGN
jgi:hypothetical protein